MTVSQMHLAFGVTLRAQGGHEDFQSEEIDIYLNLAVRSFIDARKPLLRQDDGIAIGDVRTLMSTKVYSGAEVNDHVSFENVRTADLAALPEPFEYAIGARAKVSEDSKWKEIYFTSYPDFLANVSGDSHTPVFRHLPGTIEKNDLIVLYDITDLSITDIHFTYLTTPATIDFNLANDCNLPVHTHQQIVTVAVEFALAAIGNTE